jgi:sulfite exporter TauE/SafE/plastocyanin domain-containing protein/copper chaperone CopZ
MSRRRSRAHAHKQPASLAPSQAAALATGPAEAAADVEDLPESAELHRRAVEMREIRMGQRRAPASPRAQVTATGTTAMTFPVTGMTCRACEVRIDKFVSRLPNVERVTASAVKGQVTVECSGPVSAAAVETAINKAGYEIGHTPWLAGDPKIWMTAGVGVLLVAVVAFLASASGLGDLANSAGDLSSGGLVVALLLGLAAGVSTCMALVGGLVLGLSAAFQARRPELSGPAAMRPAAVFVVGRIVGYTLFGAVLGAVGASITMPPQLTAVLMIGVAIVMLLLGTRLTGLSPRLAGWSPTLPMGLGRSLGLSGEQGGAYSDTRAAMLGAASFFLPCGFTQAIQIFALSTGSPLYGAALLGVFAIGTAPGLLALAGLPLVVPSRAKPTLLRMVGVVVIGFALLNGVSGLRLSGLTFPAFVGVASAAAPEPGVLGADGVQRITTYQDADSYSPANVVVYAGYPVEWTMQSSTTATCAASLWAPGVGIRARLQLGPNTFQLPALPAGVLDYTCAMGMYGGRITVVEKPADAAVAGTSATAPVPEVTAAPSSVPVRTPTLTPALTPTPNPTAAPTAAIQELRTTQEEGGYSPQVAKVKAGVPITWHIESKSQYSCAAYLWVPDLEIEKVLGPGDNVIELPALKPGLLQYMCGMGMFTAYIQAE